MHCSKCNAENREGKKFCAQCGRALTLRCGSCMALYRLAFPVQILGSGRVRQANPGLVWISLAKPLPLSFRALHRTGRRI
jgi:hypothetical protein